MKTRINYIRIAYFTATLLIMLAVFMFSAQSGDSSGETSMNITQNVSQHLFLDDISRDTLEFFEQIIRKLAHFIEFAALAIVWIKMEIINSIQAVDIRHQFLYTF